MLRESADKLHRTLLRSFPGNQDYPLSAIGVQPMPASIAHFLRRTLESRLLKVGELAASPWYDVDAPVVRATRDAWRTALLSTARIPASAWPKTLEHAVRLVLAYLVRPAQTLTAFVFGSEDRPVESGAVLNRAAFFGEYPYLVAGLREYISKEHLGHVNRTPFLNLITRLDRAYTAGFGADDWMKHLAPLFAAIRPTGGSVASTGVPVELLRIFFEHKAITEAIRRLETEGEEHGTTDLDEAGLYRVLTASGRSSNTGRQAATAQRKEEPPVPQTRSKAEAPARGLTAAPEGSEEVQPLWMRFRKSEAAAPSPLSAEEALLEEMLRQAAPVSREPAEQDAAPAPGDDSADFDLDEETYAVAEAETAEPSDLAQEPPAGGSDRPKKLADVVAEALREVPPEHPAQQEATPSTPPADGAEEGAVPLWMRFRRTTDLPLGEAVSAVRPRPRKSTGSTPNDDPVHVTPPDEKAPEEMPKGADRVRQRVSTAGQAESGRPLELLERAVFGPADPERRRWFVQQLFGNREEAYGEVMRAIAGCENWPEASRIIARDVFRKHNVNIYSEPAIAFTDAVEAYFRQTKRP